VITSDATQAVLAAQLRSVFPGAQEIARLMEDFPPVRHTPRDTAMDERAIAWVDPNIFKVFPLPVLAGNLDTALDQPDTAVITRAMARKYFGRDLPVGDTLQLQAGVPPPPGSPPQPPGTPAPWHTVRITAVLKDLPSNTNLTTEMFVSGRSAYAGLAILDSRPPAFGNVSTQTFARLKPGVTAADLQSALDKAGGPENQLFSRLTAGSSFAFHAVPVSEAHLAPPPSLTAVTIKPTGSRPVAYGIAGVGALIVLVAAINFVTLMTARAARRGIEVGIRKATGAQQADLMLQFIGEALLQVAFAAVIGVLLAELLLPAFNAFIQRSLSLNFLADPALLLGAAAVAVTVGLLAAVYPALVLSSFRPALVLKGGVVQASGSPMARSSLVVVQFAILVGLIVTTTTVYRQTQFALGRGLGNVDSKLIVGIITPCNNAFPDEVRKLPGVAAAACSSLNALNTPNAKNIVPVQVGGGRQVNFDVAPVDFGFLETYTVHPIAGRLFSRQYGQDNVMANPQNTAAPSVVINETAQPRLLQSQDGRRPPDEMAGAASGAARRAAGTCGPVFVRDHRRGPGCAEDRARASRSHLLLRVAEGDERADDPYEWPGHPRHGQGHRRHLEAGQRRPAAAGAIPVAVPPDPLPRPDHPGRYRRHLRRPRRADRVPGPVRPLRLHHRAAHQGDRGAQGHGRRHPAGRAATALAVHHPGAGRHRRRHTARLFRHELVAARLHLPRDPVGRDLRGGGRGGGGDRLGDGFLPVVHGRPRQAGGRAEVRIGQYA
jgi:hypothetical protein